MKFIFQKSVSYSRYSTQAQDHIPRSDAWMIYESSERFYFSVFLHRRHIEILDDLRCGFLLCACWYQFYRRNVSHTRHNATTSQPCTSSTLFGHRVGREDLNIKCRQFGFQNNYELGWWLDEFIKRLIGRKFVYFRFLMPWLRLRWFW